MRTALAILGTYAAVSAVAAIAVARIGYVLKRRRARSTFCKPERKVVR